MHVSGLIEIVENGIALENVISTEPLPYFELGWWSHGNTILVFDFSNGTGFLTRLERNECFVQKLVSKMVRIATIATIIIVSCMPFRYIF